MKRIFIICSLSLVIGACGSGKSGSGSASDSTATTAKPAATDSTAGSATSAPGAQLIAKYDCLGCHKEHEKLIGPAYADVADKYKSAPAGIVDTLANKVINGGKGNWGDVPMSGHPSISVDDARSMVKYILSLKK